MPPIEDILGQALADAFNAVAIDITAQEIQLVRPSRREHGDWTSNAAMQAATATGRKPRELAQEISAIIRDAPPAHVESVEVAGPGFINFKLHDSWLHEVLIDAVTSGEEGFARPRLADGNRIQVEFVSANPTGPIHVGNGWWGS